MRSTVVSVIFYQVRKVVLGIFNYCYTLNMEKKMAVAYCNRSKHFFLEEMAEVCPKFK